MPFFVFVLFSAPFERLAIIPIPREPKFAGTDTTEQIRDILNMAGYKGGLPVL